MSHKPITLPGIFADDPTAVPMPAPLPPSERVGFAVVGLGRLTLETILPAFGESKRARVTALVSGDPDKAQRVAKLYGVGSVYDYASFNRIAADPEIRAVYIVLPNDLHAEYTVRAARAGKHVLCEKPMATTISECQAMIDACTAARVKLMIAYRVQLEPHHAEVQKRMRAGALGRVKLISMENMQAQSQRIDQIRLSKERGGGPLGDVGIYCLNTARFLLGEEPVEVGAHAYSTPGDARFREVDETVVWWMRFESGVIAQCLCSFGAHESRRYRVIGEDGWLEMDPAFSYGGLRLRHASKDGIVDVEVEATNHFAAELDHLAECIAEDHEVVIPGRDGLRDQVVMDAIVHAARTGRAVLL